MKANSNKPGLLQRKYSMEFLFAGVMLVIFLAGWISVLALVGVVLLMMLAVGVSID